MKSGERTRLACWRWRLAIANFPDIFAGVNLSEIKAATLQLSSNELAKLAAFVAEQNNDYGTTKHELARFVKRTRKQIARDRKAGRMKAFSGDLEADIAN